MSSLQQVVTPCIDDHQILLEDHETIGEFSASCAQSVLKYLYWQELGDQINYGLCGIQNQRHEVYCAYLDHTRLSTFRGCARQFLTAVPILNLLRLTQVHVLMDYQLVYVGTVCWKRYPVDQPRETLSVTNARESIRLIHSLTIFLSPLSTFRPIFPKLPLNPTLHIRRQCGSYSNAHHRTKPKFKACKQNAQSRFG